jgi:hypothetical protein
MFIRNVFNIIHIVSALSIICASKGLDIIIGDETNATYYAKENTDIQPFLLKAFQSSKLNEYINVRIAPGTYYVSGALQMPSNTHLFGSLNDQNVLMTKIMINSTKSSDLSVLQVFSKSNISISSIKLDSFNAFLGTNCDINGIYTQNAINIVVRNVELSNFRSGLYMVGNDVTITGPIEVDRVQSQNNSYDGIVISFAQGVNVHDCTVMYNNRHGINMFGKLEKVEMQKNNVHNNGNTTSLTGCGINIEMNKGTNAIINDVVVQSNTLTNNPLGVCLQGTQGGITNIKIQNNDIVAKSKKACISTEDVKLTIIENNKCEISQTVRSPKKSSSHMQMQCVNWYLLVQVVLLMIVLIM